MQHHYNFPLLSIAEFQILGVGVSNLWVERRSASFCTFRSVFPKGVDDPFFHAARTSPRIVFAPGIKSEYLLPALSAKETNNRNPPVAGTVMLQTFPGDSASGQQYSWAAKLNLFIFKPVFFKPDNLLAGDFWELMPTHLQAAKSEKIVI